jgi:hypothetical protein
VATSPATVSRVQPGCHRRARRETDAASLFQELSILVRRYSGMSIQFNFTPELHLVDGRIIRNIEDAIAFAREQEARPGVDRRDEVLHALERARGREEAHAAAHLFLRWLEELEIVD